ncbi:MAG: hypothetical protein MRY79_05805, partial [Alphaproteobacteria bacterium]|nr:hypothetical protein [Alphaproteobacteria bacterium]
FQRYRARLLMQGSAAQIFDGTAYYGAALGKFVVEGPISGKFVQGFLNVVKEQPLKERQKQVRNFLVFIDEVKGLKNLSDQDNRTLQSLYDALKA